MLAILKSLHGILCIQKYRFSKLKLQVFICYQHINLCPMDEVCIFCSFSTIKPIKLGISLAFFQTSFYNILIDKKFKPYVPLNFCLKNRMTPKAGATRAACEPMGAKAVTDNAPLGPAEAPWPGWVKAGCLAKPGGLYLETQLAGHSSLLKKLNSA